MDEVIVTGIFTRKASSYTGAVVTMTAKDIMRAGNQNLFQSLKILTRRYSSWITWRWVRTRMRFRK